MQAWKETTAGTLLTSTSSDWDCLPQLFKERSHQICCKIWICRRRIPSWPWWYSTTFASYKLYRGHFLVLAVWEFFTSMFPKKWVGRREAAPSLACYSDFNPLDFYFWWYLKSTLYATEVSDVQDLQQRIQNGFKMIRSIPRIFQRLR